MKDAEKTPEAEKAPEAPKMRQIVIETNGSDISILRAEVAGSLELAAILEALLRKIRP
jgi:tRNA threonylcarbamoyladenosine modification (KEOPS) complex  Pcc1 subunit